MKKERLIAQTTNVLICQNDPDARGTTRLLLMLVKYLKLIGEHKVNAYTSESVENILQIFNCFFSLTDDFESLQQLVWELLNDEKNEDEFWDFMEVWSPDREEIRTGLDGTNQEGLKEICSFLGGILRKKEGITSRRSQRSMKSSYRTSLVSPHPIEDERPEEPRLTSP